MLLVLLLCIIFLFICVNSIFFYINDSRKCKFPGPLPLPLLGNGHLFIGSSSEFLRLLTRLLDQFGDVLRVYIMSQRYIFIANPKYVEIVMANNDFNTKSDEYRYLHPWLGQGLLTASGNRWRTHRKLLTPSFHFNILKSFLPVFLKNDEIFVKKLENLAHGKPIDVFPIMALLALDNISETSMGVSINAQGNSESKYVKAVNEMTELTFDRMRKVFLRYDFLFNLLPHKKRQDQALAVLHHQTNSVISDRRQVLDESNTTLENYDDQDIGTKKKSSFLDLLLLSTVDGKKLNNETIREEVDTFMFEGHDTTTSGLSFACYCISQNPKVQDKLLEEQKKIFDKDILNRHPTFADLNEMKYLESVIKESLRLYPSVPIVGRQINDDRKIDGKIIPKDTSILIGIMHMQRSPLLFEDPLSFQPERFENMTADQKSAYNWIAFSAGSRNCIGQKFAMMELKVVLSSIIRRFQLLPSSIEPILCGDLILRSENGVHVGFVPRKMKI